MGATATEILLRIREGERLFSAYRELVHEQLWMPLQKSLLSQVMWQQHLRDAMRATAFQLTYSPKD